MRFWRTWSPALLCGLILPLCILPVQPFVASGMNDDWSYMQVATVLYSTGHVVYNGWSAPMLGWQLFWTDLLMHLFGDSFWVIRLGTVLVGSASAVLFQRVLVRSGISERLAVLGTGTLVLSPLFLPLAFSYMTDVYGFFSLVICLWLCLRALQPATDRATLLWMAAAILSNAITGTTRQVAWLGVLVICPSALWLLRRRHRVVLPSAAMLLIAWAFILWCMQWFKAQPFTQTESFSNLFNRTALVVLLRAERGVLLTVIMLLLPPLLLLMPSLPRRRMLQLIAGGALFALSVVAGSTMLHRSIFRSMVFPYLGNYISINGALDGTWLHGERPIVLNMAARSVWTAVGLVTAAALMLSLRQRRAVLKATDALQVEWRQLNVLLLPYLAVYLVLLVPRALGGAMFDRYLLPVLAIALLYLLRFYQQRIPPQPQWPAWLTLAILAAYSVGTTHDLFALHRARVAAVQTLLDRGVDPAAIDGGFEFNGVQEVRRTGYVHAPRLRETSGQVIPVIDDSPQTCEPQQIMILPGLHPRYGLSYDPAMCDGPTSFPPVTYTAWLGPHKVRIFIIGLAPHEWKP